jgi:DNA-binding NtrC family response regulator
MVANSLNCFSLTQGLAWPKWNCPLSDPGTLWMALKKIYSNMEDTKDQSHFFPLSNETKIPSFLDWQMLFLHPFKNALEFDCQETCFLHYAGFQGTLPTRYEKRIHQILEMGLLSTSKFYITDKTKVLNQKIIDAQKQTELLEKELDEKRKKQIQRVFQKSQEEFLWLPSGKAPLTKRRGILTTIHNSQMRKLFSLLDKIQSSKAPVLIHGESGSGKELVAHAIQSECTLVQGPYLAVNCAAIAPDIMESELFGHIRGSFSGADLDREGLFEQANGGCLFLDEIGDMPLMMQVKLLRVLQEREIRRVGDSQTIPVDVRLICASHQSLEEMVKKGTFRDDLFYRLNVIPIHLPPLRKRKEDIVPLALHFLNQFARRQSVSLIIHPQVAQAFRSYSWPGNIRELKNLMEKLATICEQPQIRLEDLPKNIRHEYEKTRSSDKPQKNALLGRPLHQEIIQFEKRYIQNTMSRHANNISQAARACKMHRSTFRRILQRHGIQKGEKIAAD